MNIKAFLRRDLLTFRAEEEDVKLAQPALDLLGHMAYKTSLRYALNLISPSHLLAQRRKSPHVEIEDVKLAYRYFIDVERSAAYAAATSGMMFGEEEVVGGNDGDYIGSKAAQKQGSAMDTSA